MTRRAGWLAASGTLWATTGWVSPLSVSSPTSSSGVVASTLTATRWATRICPSLASAQSRAARLHTVPIAVYPERSAKPIWPRVAYPCAIPAPNPSTRPRRRHAAINVPAVSRINRHLDGALGRIRAGHGVIEKHHDPVAGELVERAFELADEWPQCAMIIAQEVQHLLGFRCLGEGSVAAQVAKDDDDLAAMTFEDFLVPVRDNQLGQLRREKALQPSDPA